MKNIFFKTTNGITEKLLKNKYIEYYNILMETIKEKDISISERIYLYQNNMIEKPTCLNCSNKVKFIKFYKGYNKYCSRKCSAINTHKNLDTKLKRTKHLIELNSNKEKRKEMTNKANNTKLHFSIEKKDNINNKRISTNLEKYGVDNISKNLIIKEKMHTEKSKERKLATLMNKSISHIIDSGYNYISMDNDTFNIGCTACNTVFNIKKYLFNNRKRFNKTICLNCNKIGGTSDFENKVCNFIKENHDGLILPGYMGLKKYEIDIYLPLLKLGFECNGLWWHSEMYRDKNYHIDKLNFFKENGITIINIWEDDWNFKQNIIKNRIIYKLNKIKDTIFARKCYISEVNSKLSREFLDENHIQGYCVSKINLGLYYNNELISLMTFGSLRKNLGQVSKINNYELLRYCSKLNYKIPGGFSKLLKFFKQKYNPETIISYCDISFNDGNSYINTGFNFIKNTVPNYYWFHKDEGIRINRWRFRKDILVKKGYDSSKTEIEIMSSLGYYRIWDCGSKLYKIY